MLSPLYKQIYTFVSKYQNLLCALFLVLSLFLIFIGRVQLDHFNRYAFILTLFGVGLIVFLPLAYFIFTVPLILIQKLKNGFLASKKLVAAAFLIFVIMYSSRFLLSLWIEYPVNFYLTYLEDEYPFMILLQLGCSVVIGSMSLVLLIRKKIPLMGFNNIPSILLYACFVLIVSVCLWVKGVPINIQSNLRLFLLWLLPAIAGLLAVRNQLSHPNNA